MTLVRDSRTRFGRFGAMVLAVLGLWAGLVPASAMGQMTWALRPPSDPLPSSGHAMAYDSARGVTVLFGGGSGGSLGSRFTSETWEWNGSTWTLRSSSGPSPRSSHAMAYDAARRVTVLFGGGSTGSYNNETWEWNGTTWTLRSTSGPSPRTGHEMAYDASRRVIVLFGGRTMNNNFSGETWEWNGTSWTQRAVSGPSPRYGHAMAYDAARRVIVLFGGQATNGLSGETWEWNGSTWTLRSTVGPSPRRDHTMAYDAARRVIIIFSGATALPPPLHFEQNGETWEWNGTTWTQRADSGPAPREYSAMVYDASRGVTFLFGGWVGWAYFGSLNGESWTWNGFTWTLLATSTPLPRSSHAMAYDAARGVTVLFGGLRSYFYYSNQTQFSGETWESAGIGWTLRSTGGPSPRSLHAMAYDAARGVTVLFGGNTSSGSNGETWEWDGTSWVLRASSGPSPRTSHAMAYDAARGVTVLFGGATDSPNGETWEWDGTSWVLRASSGPSPRAGHAMAYDAARGVTVLFGGASDSPNGETWEWDGTLWVLRASSGPSPRTGHAMAYDAARGVTVLFGGTNCVDDTWVWDGTTWTQQARNITIPLFWRYSHAMAYDAARAATVMFGGYCGGDDRFPETWEWVCSNPVSITSPPSNLSLLAGQTATFSVGVSGPATSYQWRRNGLNLSDGARISGSTTATLRITAVQLSDEGAYDCVVTGVCNRATSYGAVLNVRCAADIASTVATPGPDGQVDNGDFLLFVASFFTADCDGAAIPCNPADIAQTDAAPGPDGQVDNGDFLLFIASFFAGC